MTRQNVKQPEVITKQLFETIGCKYYTVVQILVINLEYYVLQAAIMFFERDLKLLYRFFESVAREKRYNNLRSARINRMNK